VTCAVLLLDPPGRRVSGPVRVLLAALALLAASTVSLGMVARNSHYFTDAIAGAALGTGVVLACALTLDRAWSRRTGSRSNAIDPLEQ
jgi:membrane-associated phospholipid phosphatase